MRASTDTSQERRESKLAEVEEVVSGAKRPAPMCREHGLAEELLLRWRREVAERGDAAFGPPDETSVIAPWSATAPMTARAEWVSARPMTILASLDTL